MATYGYVMGSTWRCFSRDNLYSTSTDRCSHRKRYFIIIWSFLTSGWVSHFTCLKKRYIHGLCLGLPWMDVPVAMCLTLVVDLLTWGRTWMDTFCISRIDSSSSSGWFWKNVTGLSDTKVLFPRCINFEASLAQQPTAKQKMSSWTGSQQYHRRFWVSVVVAGYGVIASQLCQYSGIG